MINSSIFKSYDIRGVYPKQLNENAAYQIGRAFVKHTGAKKVVVAYDARLSSPELFLALAQGLFAEGAHIATIGQVPTECLYFAVAQYDFDAGIMITASHNPKEYNGFKMIKRNGNDIIIVRGLDLLPVIEKDTGAPLKKGARPSTQIKDLSALVLEDYVKFILQFSGDIKPFKVIVDASNGVIGKVISRLVAGVRPPLAGGGRTPAKLSVEMIELNFKPDGNFPNHSPNPLEAGASNDISEEIKKQKADFGFMFDADADRIFLVNEKGTLVAADIVLLLLAKYFLNKNPGAAIAYNAICSKAVPEFVKKWGGVPMRTAVGFVNVREALIKNNGVMGGELSGHYCFKDYFYMDSGMIAFLTILQVISQDGRPVSEIVKELSLYFKSAELNFELSNKEAVLEKIKEKYTDGKQDFLDGITVEYKDWWFNVRPSNTESLLRLTIEAGTPELLEEKKKELSDFISK